MENPFESGTRKLIPATLIYARHQNEILMLHRTQRPQDDHSGKWNGLGGKLEEGESMFEGASREFQEEAGIKIPPERFNMLGTLQFPFFKPHKNEDWLVFVMTVALGNHEVPQSSCSEGILQFIHCDRLLDLNLWEGDRHFIGLIQEQRPFAGCIWYENGKLKRWSVKALGAF